MSKFKGKRVLVVGFGRSGVAVAKYMTQQGAKVLVTDTKQRSELAESIQACEELKLDYELGKHSDATFQGADLIVVSPGVPLNLKQIEDARSRGIPITSEVELAAPHLTAPIIGITGTNGKTTTTLLIGEMFKADGKNVFVGGNLGTPLLDIVNEGLKPDVVVAELSSFQLELVEQLQLKVGVFTNIEEDHLDRYGEMSAYIAAKKRMLRACQKESVVILNYDDATVASFAEGCISRTFWYTRKNPMKIGGHFAERFTGAYCNWEEKRLHVKTGSSGGYGSGSAKEEVYDLSQFRLLGEHNRENLLAAVLAARAVGASEKAIQTVINSFRGVPHRLEFIRKKDGVFFFNDSKGTNVMSVKRSLSAFKNNPVILIAGGKDKNMDFTPLQDLVKNRVKILILLGEAKEKMNRAIGDFAETFLVGTFEEAVLLAFQKSRTGDIILLSPGCASYDMFRNFEERGDYFKKLVNQL